MLSEFSPAVRSSNAAIGWRDPRNVPFLPFERDIEATRGQAPNSPFTGEIPGSFAVDMPPLRNTPIRPFEWWKFKAPEKNNLRNQGLGRA